MRARRPELRAVTITILLGTLALTLAVVIGYAWWSTQHGLTHHAQEKVEVIAQLLRNSMPLSPEGCADRTKLGALLESVGEDYGASRMEIARGAVVSRQYGPSKTTYAPDEQVRRAFQTGQSITLIETRGGQRYVRRLKVMEASHGCLACHKAAPGDALGIVDVSFNLNRVQSTPPDFYRNLILISLLVTVIAVLLVLLIFFRINMARRVESVTAMTSAIASGDLERRVLPLPGTGMDGLAWAINEMAESLQAHEETLVQQRQELEKANRRLEILMQEAHHRIKNNLQTVADLLSLETSRCPASQGKCLKDSIQRVKSIAVVHELLSAEQAESTNVRQLVERLLETAIRNVALPNQRIAGSVDSKDLSLASKQATSLALVLNELFDNALMHGLADRSTGRVTVTVQAQNGLATLSVQDDGIGLPPDFTWETHEQLGLRIVRTLVKRDLGGEFTIQKDDGGTTATITFPL